ncbi:hypothetical protein Rs2_06142 [Raphanus sativus]|nr:hypothetical protein Rs2_06142 [Raphanus sativus]
MSTFWIYRNTLACPSVFNGLAARLSPDSGVDPKVVVAIVGGKKRISLTLGPLSPCDVDPKYEKGVDQQLMDEARIVLLFREGEMGKDRITLRANFNFLSRNENTNMEYNTCSYALISGFYP